eukprot:gnl/TRDRNA2_/TRDRNA2_199333_c0_seq1.p1 gnl/TRDRNA2_/TRDRNA2_199333_c0~~gnl/TRDRNA2_/TRDRNA2_199333_c0_seq1.p1  ORF type:complete len:305 (+),score=42.15 gnl/TRDRNA2_/TRDRNA2_199333_c0_seq1:29-943(+)
MLKFSEPPQRFRQQQRWQRGNPALKLAAVAWLLALRSSASFRIIGAGYGRTGTASLAKAFDILGYRCYHGGSENQRLSGNHSGDWLKAIRSVRSPEGGTTQLFRLVDGLLQQGYDATTDEPASLFTLLLLERFPDAKVVLTTHSRGSAAWFESMIRLSNVLYLAGYSPYQQHSESFRTMVTAMWSEAPRRCTFPLTGDAQEGCVSDYEQHNAEIRQRVPSSQLLDFQVSDGWEPLCSFLNVSVPDVPFPRENEGRNLRMEAIRMRVIIVWDSCGLIVLILVVVGCVAQCGKQPEDNEDVDTKED